MRLHYLSDWDAGINSTIVYRRFESVEQLRGVMRDAARYDWNATLADLQLENQVP